ALRVPVHHLHSSIYKPEVVESFKSCVYRNPPLIIESEGLSRPIEGSSHPADLGDYGVMALRGELIHMLKEFFPAEIAALLALLFQKLLNLGLRSYGSVVCAREPECFLAPHSLIPDHNVLYGMLEGMP